MTTASFGDMASRQHSSDKKQPSSGFESHKREESPSLPKTTEAPKTTGGVTDNKPKLFKGSSTNPFTKKTTTTGPSFAGGAATSAPKTDGLFYPG